MPYRDRKSERDVSQTGARLRMEGSFEGLDLKEFPLLLPRSTDII